METIEVAVIVIVVAVVGLCVWVERQSRLAAVTVERASRYTVDPIP